MPRVLRVDVANHIYHVLNRANARVQIFSKNSDYKLFEQIVEEALERFEVDLLAYCIMPNHWHLVLYPKIDGELAKFMGWLTNTHTRRYHAQNKTIGQGHLYQGRYKSFICQDDKHFLTLCRYVERNAKKADLCTRAENWKWSSVYRREHGGIEQKKILSNWPVLIPQDYLTWLNQPQTASEEEAIELATRRNSPYGSDLWKSSIIKQYGLEQTVRNPWRPKKCG